jgi:hypothetical protein
LKLEEGELSKQEALFLQKEDELKKKERVSTKSCWFFDKANNFSDLFFLIEITAHSVEC